MTNDEVKKKMSDDIAENVLKDGKDGIKQNMLEIFDEFIDEYADEMWQVVNEFIKLKSENAELKHRAEVSGKALELCETAYILALNGKRHEGISQQAIVSDLGVHKFFIKQAEKELSEERI